MWDSLLTAEMSDRLNDLNALRFLTSELKEETQELIEVIHIRELVGHLPQMNQF